MIKVVALNYLNAFIIFFWIVIAIVSFALFFEYNMYAANRIANKEFMGAFFVLYSHYIF